MFQLVYRRHRNEVLSVLVALLLCAGLSVGGVNGAEAAEKPNVLFILTEDQGAHLSLLGTPGLRTPHIDALAKSGVYFRNAFVAYPVCSASKAAIYTGLHSHANGILNNTPNFHKPASRLTAEERGNRLYGVNRVHARYTTLTEILHAEGYYQGVTHKLHVAPNEKFPYDEFLHGGRRQIQAFIDRAQQKQQPWFLLVNIPNSHRPYPNSDKQPIRVNPDEVQLPPYLPDTPIVRKDWAEYLAAVEQADSITGEALAVLRESGQQEQTIVIFMSDHGPTFQHGKMTLYDLGLRVPLIFSGPNIAREQQTDVLASELDLMPTLLDLIGIDTGKFVNYPLHGVSLQGVLTGAAKQGGHELIFAEISDRGPLPNDGMQERSVFDGRWKLIYREKVETGWRQVNADSRQFPIWGNRTYDETVRHRESFPLQYRILAEMDPQHLGGEVPRVELYDLKGDPHELQNLVEQQQFAPVRDRLLDSLRAWCRRTDDRSVSP